MVEVMNNGKWEGLVDVLVLFEVEIGNLMKEVRPVWLDVTGCGRAEVEVKSKVEPFMYRTPERISEIDGNLLDVSLPLGVRGLSSLTVLDSSLRAINTTAGSI